MNGAPRHHAWVFTPACAPATLTHRVVTGLSRQHLADVIVELADPWTAAHQGALYLQLWVGGELERFQPPGLEVVLSPHPRHGVVADSKMLGWRRQGGGQDLSAPVASDGLGSARARLVAQPVQAMLGVALPPQDDGRARAANLLGDLGVGGALGGQQQDLGHRLLAVRPVELVNGRLGLGVQLPDPLMRCRAGALGQVRWLATDVLPVAVPSRLSGPLGSRPPASRRSTGCITAGLAGAPASAAVSGRGVPG